MQLEKIFKAMVMAEGKNNVILRLVFYSDETGEIFFNNGIDHLTNDMEGDDLWTLCASFDTPEECLELLEDNDFVF